MSEARPDGALPASSREEAKQETRRALIRAARDAFNEGGLDGPSLDAICERAGYTRGAFYVHFRDRDDLVAAVMEDTLREVVDGVIGGGDAGDLASTVSRYVAVADLMRRSGPGGVRFHQLLEACRRTPRIGALFVRVLGEARARLEEAARAAQQAGRAGDRTGAGELASLLLLLALGVLVADELALPVDLERSRDALLRLLETR